MHEAMRGAVLGVVVNLTEPTLQATVTALLEEATSAMFKGKQNAAER